MLTKNRVALVIVNVAQAAGQAMAARKHWNPASSGMTGFPC